MTTIVGRIKASVHLLAMALVLAISTFSVWAQPEDADQRNLADEFVEQIDSRRTDSAAESLTVNPTLNKHAWAAVAAMAQALVDDPDAPLPELAPDPERLQADIPAAAEIRQVIWVTPNSTELGKRVSGWQDAQETEMTHVALAVRSAARQDNRQALVAVGLVARLLPSIDPELINRGQRDFHLHCDACGKDNLVQLRVPPRASVLPRYHPNIQFHRKGIWYRSDSNWTSDYSDGKKWLEGRS